MASKVNFRKINVKDQTHYTYRSVTGETFTIYPDEIAGVTIEIIHDLCRADNREVDQTLKQSRCPLTDSEKRDIQAWREDAEHPERTKADFPDGFQRWNLPIDGLWYEDGETASLDCDPAMCEAFKRTQTDTPPEIERLREFVSTLSERQQQLYRLVYIDGYQLKEAALVMGVSHQRASTLDKQLRTNIKNHFRK